MIKYIDELKRIIFINSFERGCFILTSGKTSNFYLDVKQTTLDPKGSMLISLLLIKKIIENNIQSIGGPIIGADPIIGSVITLNRLKNCRNTRGFMVRKEEKKHGKNKLIEGRIKEYDRVMVVDDVSTTGKSLYKAIYAVERIGCEVIKVVSVVDRNEGGRGLFKNLGYDYEPLVKIEDIFELEKEYNNGK